MNVEKEKSYIGIIPARGGSKRLKGKNILPLGGRPLISWSIEAGLSSGYIDELIVTTDCSEIAEISRRYGADIPFIRPADLATDEASSYDVIRHVIEFYKEDRNREFDFLVLLQPTSPFRDSDDIVKAITFLEEQNADAVISVCRASHSPLWTNTLGEDLSMNNFLDGKLKNKRSQELEEYYRLNGAIYICKIESFLNEGSLFLSDNIYAYIMDEIKSVDIDTELDFKFAQFLLEYS